MKGSASCTQRVQLNHFTSTILQSMADYKSPWKKKDKCDTLYSMYTLTSPLLNFDLGCGANTRVHEASGEKLKIYALFYYHYYCC